MNLWEGEKGLCPQPYPDFKRVCNHIIRFYSTGCPREAIGVPFGTKEFNFTSYLNYARDNFIGRQWLFQLMENSLYHSRQGVSGVFITGDPGTGKSALTAQLICSRKSSPTFYDHVLGYHLCRRSDRNTQNGGKFVRNLADMIARRLPEYGYMVADNSRVQRSLNNDCVTIQDCVRCFQEAILTPLGLLKNKPQENQYVVIDSLEDCQSETAPSFVNLLDKKLRFPSWLKLVMTSGNETSFSINSNHFIKLKINPEDIRNKQDIRTFLAAKLSQDGPLIRPIKFGFGDNSTRNTARLTSALLSKSQGNFLLAKEMLHFWEISKAEKIDPYSLPETLGELYKRQFERLYSPAENFEPLRRVLELLVASFQPVSFKQIFDILRRKENLKEASRLKYRMSELGHFLRYEENDRVTIYHPSLTEWLTSGSNTNGPFYVRKKKGHEMFCDYYFSLITEGHNSSLPEHFLNFAQNIAHGSWKKDFVRKFLTVPSKVFDSSDPTINRTLLHLAATINSTDALDLLLRHVTYDDYIDNRGITPAFLAAEHGLVRNLALMVKKGANIHHETKSLSSTYKLQGEESVESDSMSIRCNPLFQSKSKLFSSTMLHAAAHGGHLEVVNLLIDNGANISTVNGVHLTALQIAAEKGHAEVVKTLYEAGAVPDQTALHHAAANNKLEVVKYLLQIGVTDKCMRCDGSFYWLNGKYRLQRDNFSIPSFARLYKDCIHSNSKIKRFEIDLEHGSTKDKEGELYDDKHLIFCETALHAAVSAGHEAVVRELTSHPATALTCRDYSGRTPLHEAVRKGNSRIVDLLLWKDPKLVYETCNHLQSFHENIIPLAWTFHDGTTCNMTIKSQQLSFEEVTEYDKDVCHCRYTPLHLAARYGLTHIGRHLISSGAKVDAPDCLGATPLHVAACHNHIVFVHVIAHANFGVNVNSKSSNGSTPLHSAAACGAVEVIDHLIYHGANVTAVDEGNLSPLHYSILHVRPLNREKQLIRTNSCGVKLLLTTVDRRGRVHFRMAGNLIYIEKKYRWLVAFLHLIERGSKINSVDSYGRTPLHLASANGLADAVVFLLRKGAKIEIRDTFGKTPLDVAVENCTVESTSPSFVIGRRFLDLPKHLRDNEMVVYLLLSNGASFKKCERNSTSLLHHALAKNQPYIAQILLFKGASVHCKDSFGRTPALALIANGGSWTDILLKHLHYSTAIKCGEPFISSVFHLFCFFPPKRQDNNFFQQIRCKKQICLSRKSFLKRALRRHRLKNKIIDSCLDAEGFRPIHRAAQGANLIGVRSLLKLGANTSLLSPQGHDAITLAILHSGGSIWHFHDKKELIARNDNASLVALELLHHATKTRSFQIVCDSSKSEMTLYHLAASRGLVKFIQEILKEKERHQLDVNCPNKDGVTPLYLAEVFSFETNESSYNPWREVATIIKEHGGKMVFPEKDAEYTIIYERLYGWIPNRLELSLRPDVLGFVLALWSKFQDRQKSQRQYNCNWDWTLENNNSVLSSSHGAVFNEITRQWGLMRRKCTIIKPFQPEVGAYLSFNGDIKKCLVQHKRLIYSTIIYSNNIIKTAYAIDKAIGTGAKVKVRYKKVLRISQTALFYLMRWWHLRMFQDFGCFKSVLDKYRPFLLDERKMTQVIATFTRSHLDWSLEVTCSFIKIVFHAYLSSDLCSDGIIDINSVLRNQYPDFTRNRMGWTVDQTESWPLEFLFKFSLGLYHQYEYLKILSVGLEQGTRLALHSEKFEREWRREWETHLGRLCS